MAEKEVSLSKLGESDHSKNNKLWPIFLDWKFLDLLGHKESDIV